MTMQSRDLRRAVAAVTMCVGAAVAGGRAQVKPSDQPLALQQIPWRHIGPASFGGRIDDIEAVPANPSTIFVGTASGGVFKSVNNGVTWRPVFDRDGSALSIGDIAIAPSDPNIVWVGTGEPNNRQSSSWGDGVYQSLDGGETWTHRGLKDSHHVGRIAIHPRNPDVVFVAALGHLWGPNEQRGLYRTKDGGRTWEKVLGVAAAGGSSAAARAVDSTDRSTAAPRGRRSPPAFRPATSVASGSKSRRVIRTSSTRSSNTRRAACSVPTIAARPGRGRIG